MELLSQDAIEEVHDKALTLLEETGIEFMLGCLEAAAAGHTVDDTQIVRFDREGLMEAVSAPSSFTMKARNPAHDHIGGDRIVWGSASSAPTMTWMRRRPGTRSISRTS